MTTEPVVESGKLNLKGRCCRILHLLRAITVEPMLFLSGAAVNLSFISIQFLFLEKICQLELGYSKEECNNGLYESHVNNTIATEAHRAMAWWNMITVSMLQTSAVVMIVLFGSWSDKYSRKTPLMVPLLSYIMYYSLLMVNVYFHETPVYFIVLSHIPIAIAGKSVIETLSMAYVVEDETGSSKTLRLFIAMATERLGAFSTKFFSAEVYMLWGYYPVFASSIILVILAGVYMIFWLKDPPRQLIERKNIKSQIREIFEI